MKSLNEQGKIFINIMISLESWYMEKGKQFPETALMPNTSSPKTCVSFFLQNSTNLLNSYPTDSESLHVNHLEIATRTIFKQYTCTVIIYTK